MYPEVPQKKGLALNFYEILLNKDKIKVWRGAYSKDAFDNYKESLPGYFFYRYTASYKGWIYAWQCRPTDTTLHSEFAPVDVTVEEAAPVFAKVIEEAIVQFFKGKRYEIFKQKYSSMWEVRLQKELDFIHSMITYAQELLAISYLRREFLEVG